MCIHDRHWINAHAGATVTVRTRGDTAMDFAHSERTRDYLKRIEAFIR